MKLRTNKTASKRIRATGSGKLQQPTTSAQHLRHKKSSRILSNAKKHVSVAKVNAKRLRSLLPYL